MNNIVVGFALCGSFCTFETALDAMRRLRDAGASIVPILSFHAGKIDTRFGSAESFRARIEAIADRSIIDTIEAAEPIGPQKMCDVLLVAPCTGNTLGKLASGITDTPVTMAVKSHLRNKRPVVLAVSTNDALSASARNLGDLLNRKHYFFVPMSQDDFAKKPTSVVADFSRIEETLAQALEGIQIQPVLL